MQYSEKVMEHFRNPRNMGKMKNPDGVGVVGNPICGDMTTMTIKVKNNRIEKIKFTTMGCGAAKAVSSIITEMAKGKTLDDAMKITYEAVIETIGELPTNELHCSKLGADALQKAIMDYYAKKGGKVPKDKHVEYIGGRRGKCYCPYCNSETSRASPYCTKCGKPL